MKKKIFFAVYCLLMIGGLILFLIFAPNLMKNDTIKDKPKNETNLYATKINLNCSKEITLSAGASVTLNENFLFVQPSSFKNQVSTRLVHKSGADNGITFSGNVITAIDECKFLITFAVPKSNTTEIYDNLSVTVVSKDEDSNVNILNNNFTNETTIELNDMLEIDESFKTYSIQSNNNLTFENNKISFIEVGSSNISLNLQTNYLTYNYNFDVLISPKITTGIIVIGEDSGVIEVSADIDKYFDITYYFKNEKGEYVLQDAVVTMDSTDYATDLEVLAPIITMKCKAKGSFKISIIPTNTEIEQRDIIIIIK